MPRPAGRTLPLSLPRRFICDLLHFARRVPTVPVQRRMDLSEVAAARNAAAPRPSWCAVFTRAYAAVAARRPELRRSYLAFPFPRLYEHAANVATIAVERQVGDENAVLFAHLNNPEKRSLTELDALIRRFKEAPLGRITPFRRALRRSRLPRPVRRLLWWCGLNVWGRKRAQYLGTFGVSSYGGLGAASLHPLSVTTTTLNYGVIGPDGAAEVRLTYDHRVLDGTAVARALADLERVLRHDIAAELRYLRSLDAA